MRNFALLISLIFSLNVSCQIDNIAEKLGYNRILIESGLVFLNTLLKYRLIFNMFIFQSSTRLANKGYKTINIPLVLDQKVPEELKSNLTLEAV